LVVRRTSPLAGAARFARCLARATKARVGSGLDCVDLVVRSALRRGEADRGPRAFRELSDAPACGERFVE